MKTTCKALAMVLALGGLSAVYPVLADHGGLESLRGMSELTDSAKAPPMAIFNKDEEPLQRNYVQQPPVIPHDIRGYAVNLRSNKCLSCHSWEKYKTAGATKVSLTHFQTRDGHALAEISPRRYFCLQCHVPQTKSGPLVENVYKSTRDLKNQ